MLSVPVSGTPENRIVFLPLGREYSSPLGMGFAGFISRVDVMELSAFTVNYYYADSHLPGMATI